MTLPETDRSKSRLFPSLALNSVTPFPGLEIIVGSGSHRWRRGGEAHPIQDLSNCVRCLDRSDWRYRLVATNLMRSHKKS
jgi:hypothetical protein